MSIVPFMSNTFLQAKTKARNAVIDDLLSKATTKEQRFSIGRLRGLGGSDMASVLNLGFYRDQNQYDLWLDKTFRDMSAKRKFCLDAGHALEPRLAEWYTDITHNAVREAATVCDSELPYLAANFDRVIVDKDGNPQGILECKTCNHNSKIMAAGGVRYKWGKPNTYSGGVLTSESAEIDPSYVPQVQFYLMVSGLEWADVIVSIGNTDPQIYRLHKDLAYCASMRAACVEFWEEHVLTDVPPAKNFANAAKPKVTPSEVKADLSSLTEGQQSVIRSAIDAIHTQTAIVKAAEAEIEKAKDAIAPLLDKITALTATNAEGKTETLLTFKSQVRHTFNVKAFQADNPDMYKAYLKETVTERSLKVY